MSGDRYIVIFKDYATLDEVNDFANGVAANGGHIFNRYNGIINGFSADIPAHFLSFLQTSDLIQYIERDSVVTTQG